MHACNERPIRVAYASNAFRNRPASNAMYATTLQCLNSRFITKKSESAFESSICDDQSPSQETRSSHSFVPSTIDSRNLRVLIFVFHLLHDFFDMMRRLYIELVTIRCRQTNLSTNLWIQIDGICEIPHSHTGLPQYLINPPQQEMHISLIRRNVLQHLQLSQRLVIVM